MKIPSSPAVYGSYEELVKDPNVDVVYVATPHSHHFQNVMLCLKAGKHVLCEKAFTVNAEQTKILIDEAKKRKLFLMEAVWTRYFPICIQIRQLIRDGKIGEVLRVFADTSCGAPNAEEKFGVEHRMVNPDLAGGVLLDGTYLPFCNYMQFPVHSHHTQPDTDGDTVVLYSLTWCFQTLYHTQPKADRQPPSQITSQMEVYPKTGTDESVNILLTFPKSVPAGERRSQAIATGSLRITHNPGESEHVPCARIQGTKGEIEVYGMCYEPKAFKLIPTKESGESEMTVKQEFPGGARGMNWEADEVARCLRDGKLESSTMDHEESLVIMKTMDEIRKQGGLVYPEAIETTKLA